MMLMKRKGFTLAELLVVMSVIGILAIIMLSVIKGAQPNKEKVLYLKTYMQLSTIVSTLASDTTMYPNVNSSENLPYSYGDSPFYNTYVDGSKKYAEKIGLKDISGHNISKLCRLIGVEGYHVKNVSACDETGTLPDISNNTLSGLTPAFTTKDGMNFYIYTQKTEPQTSGELTGGYPATYATIVYTDTNGTKEPNCMYNEKTCINPDSYRFLISADGKMYPDDAMGLYYIQTQKNTKNMSLKDTDILETITKLMTDEQRSNNEEAYSKIKLRPLSSDNTLEVAALSNASSYPVDYSSTTSSVIAVDDGSDLNLGNQQNENFCEQKTISHCTKYNLASYDTTCPCEECEVDYEPQNGVCVDSCMYKAIANCKEMGAAPECMCQTCYYGYYIYNGGSECKRYSWY